MEEAHEAHSVSSIQSEKLQDESIIKVLEALRQASHDLHRHPSSQTADPNSFAINALLELESRSDIILSLYPSLSNLTRHLFDLKTLIYSTRRRSFLARRLDSNKISRLAAAIEAEIQAWIDSIIIEKLLRASKDVGDSDMLRDSLSRFEARVSRGFDCRLQDLVLRSRVFASLERILFDLKFSKKVREQAAMAVASLIRFNKDVFVGEVLMGPTVESLISISSVSSFRVLRELVKSIKSPLVDEIQTNLQIPKIIDSLRVTDPKISASAVDLVLEIGYYGRKEAIDAMLREGLLDKLMELQRCVLGGDLNDFEERDETKLLEMRPFAGCVARFAVQVEVGEGLRKREKRAFKIEILRRVKEASKSEAEAATVAAEVLWGSSP